MRSENFIGISVLMILKYLKNHMKLVFWLFTMHHPRLVFLWLCKVRGILRVGRLVSFDWVSCGTTHFEQTLPPLSRYRIILWLWGANPRLHNSWLKKKYPIKNSNKIMKQKPNQSFLYEGAFADDYTL